MHTFVSQKSIFYTSIVHNSKDAKYKATSYQTQLGIKFLQVCDNNRYQHVS